MPPEARNRSSFSVQDQILIAKTLINPPPLNEALRRAKHLYEENVVTTQLPESRKLKNLSTEDEVMIANMILQPPTAHDGLVDTLRKHAKDVDVR